MHALFQNRNLSFIAASTPGSLESRRSLSASDLHKLGATQEDELQNLLMKYQTTSQIPGSTSDICGESVSAKAAKRFSWFRDRKNDLSRSFERPHTNELQLVNTLPNKVSTLNVPSGKTLSKSVQSLHNMGRVSPLVHQSKDNHFTHIKTLRKQQSKSLSNILSNNNDMAERNKKPITQPPVASAYRGKVTLH